MNMQDLIAKLLWDNEELHKAAAQLCEGQPGYLEAQRQYDKTAKKVQALIGFELYEQFCSQSNCCNSYEVRAYYSLGLGLRKDVAQALEL